MLYQPTVCAALPARRMFTLAFALLIAPVAAPAALPASTNVQFKAEASVKETFDSNVYLQDESGTAANIAAAKAAGYDPVEAGKESWVTSILPKIGLEYKPAPVFGLSAAYAPDITFYHSAHSEDYVTHRGTLNLGGKVEDTTWELSNTAACIDGSNEGPVFARPGEVPAIGGIPLRDRREAFIFRNAFRLTHSFENWFIRPVASSYIHDFKTKLRYVPPADRAAYIYENYIDRQDVSGGLDLGFRAFESTFLTLGYRYGQQEQYRAPNGPGGARIDSPYDSAYHRVLFGIEGAPLEWLKLNVQLGPDIRQFSDRVNAMFPSFDDDEVLVYMDLSVTVTLSPKDTLTLRSTRFEMPAFSSFSVYEDIRNDLLWRHKVNDQLTASAGFTFYIGDWQPPVTRHDWIYTPNTSLTYAFTSKFSGEVAYSYDWVDSRTSKSSDPLTEGHEFTRHLATVGLRYVF